MTLDTLKAKLDRKKSETKELEKQVKEAEVAEMKTQEEIAKLVDLSSEVTDAVQTILDKAKIILPLGKQIIITADHMGLSTSILNQKAARTVKGNGGTKAITFEGQQISWAKLCEIKNITRTPSGSAHRDVYNKDRSLHDAIPHLCTIDQINYLA